MKFSIASSNLAWWWLLAYNTKLVYSAGTKSASQPTNPPNPGKQNAANPAKPASGTPAANPAAGSAGSKDASKDSNNTNLVELDTKNKSSTNEYDYTEGYDKAISIFTAKQNCGFKKVKSNDTVVWESSDSKKYATYVRDHHSDSVTLQLFDGTRKEFELTGTGCCQTKKWVELNPKQTNSDPSNSQPA